MHHILIVLALISSVFSDDNGLARTPPLGWRSWNFHQCEISQAIMEKAFVAMADKSRKVDGVPTSLAELGYVDIGLDDCWQKCGSYGPKKFTYHDENGVPQVELSRFPSMASMVEKAHSLGLRAGFYSNNCACADHCSDDICFVADVKSILSWKFDSVKLDGCGKEEDVVKWHKLFNTTSSYPMMIENCHNGPNIPGGKDPAQCPFHMYRSSTDIAPCFGSIIVNLQTVFDLAKNGLSYPGCWAYPDMLEVGQTNFQKTMPGLTNMESRTHFGMWAIVSSPLILGFDLSNASVVDNAWPYITNKEVLQVNQQWAGFPGSLFYNASTTKTYSPCGWWLASCAVPTVYYLYKPQPKNTMAILLANTGDATMDLKVNFNQIPGISGGKFKVRDLWKRADLGEFTDSFTAKDVAATDSAFLLLTPS